MAATARGAKSRSVRWERTLRSAETFSDDLGSVGACVGPRIGPFRRSKGDKEDYVLRRLLVAWRKTGALRFPCTVVAENGGEREPDFRLACEAAPSLSLEVIEAGEEKYPVWLTRADPPARLSEPALAAHHVISAPERAIRDAIAEKVQEFKDEARRRPCDLLVSGDAASGLLDSERILADLGRPNDLLGRFRLIHIVFGNVVYLDIFDAGPTAVDVSREYEIDYARWLREQAEALRRGATDIDSAYIAEELDGWARSDRREFASHLRNLLLHLLKWQFQDARRSASWSNSTDEARSQLQELLSEMPSMRHELRPENLARQYALARARAAKQTRLAKQCLPAECPYSAEQIVDPEFYPEPNA
ncbi:MAG: DUF29 domain-containing protein [Alphaproteobacteria bacterium]|nr:DUF29 domain-containing protein [Alphaproteobacteria bacterium]